MKDSWDHGHDTDYIDYMAQHEYDRYPLNSNFHLHRNRLHEIGEANERQRRMARVKAFCYVLVSLIILAFVGLSVYNTINS